MRTDAINYYNQLGEIYDKGYASSYWLLELAVSLTHIRQYISADTLLIDIGAGTGTYTYHLKHLVKGIKAIEPAPNMAKEFRKKNPDIDIYIARAEEIPFPDESFHVAIAMGDVLSYVSNLETAVKEIYRILKPGGYLIASVDNFHFFIKDVLKYGLPSDINKIKNIGKTVIGNTSLQFETQTFRYTHIPQMADRFGFIHKDMIFKLVAFTEDEDISDINYGVSIEFQLNRQVEYIGNAQHIQFVWQKRR
jgi:ubiquinone/menaquinone biosynthesis C-methylase UbiE